MFSLSDPVKHGKKKSENRFWLLTHDFIFLSIFLIISKHFPWIPNFCNFCESPFLHTVSKAFRKSIKEQNNVLPSEKYNEISAWSDTILSIVQFSTNS